MSSALPAGAEFYDQRIVVRCASHQNGSIIHVQPTIEDEIQRTTKRPAALIVVKAYRTQRHVARKTVQRVHTRTTPGVEIPGHEKFSICRNLIKLLRPGPTASAFSVPYKSPQKTTGSPSFRSKIKL